MTKEQFLVDAAAIFDEIEELETEPTLMGYEQGLRKAMDRLARSVMGRQLGGGTSDRRKKKR